MSSYEISIRHRTNYKSQALESQANSGTLSTYPVTQFTADQGASHFSHEATRDLLKRVHVTAVSNGEPLIGSKVL